MEQKFDFYSLALMYAMSSNKKCYIILKDDHHYYVIDHLNGCTDIVLYTNYCT